jgi:hypothetical protein
VQIDELHRLLRIEWEFAGEKLVEDDAQRIDIRPRVERLPSGLFRHDTKRYIVKRLPRPDEDPTNRPPSP